MTAESEIKTEEKKEEINRGFLELLVHPWTLIMLLDATFIFYMIRVSFLLPLAQAGTRCLAIERPELTIPLVQMTLGGSMFEGAILVFLIVLNGIVFLYPYIRDRKREQAAEEKKTGQ